MEGVHVEDNGRKQRGVSKRVAQFSKTREKIAGTIANTNKDPVPGVEARVCVALQNVAGLTREMDVMVRLEEKQCINVL